MGYVGRSEAERKQMLASLGVTSFEELLADLPEAVRHRDPIGLEKSLSEIEQRSRLSELASQNLASGQVPSFLGGGMYDHYLPAALPRLVFRSEFMTAYTPYQPEVSQGTLTAIFEFQSMIAELTGCDVANASLYDGATALAEACLVARAQTRRPRVILTGGIHPNYGQVAGTIIGADSITEMAASNGLIDVDRLRAEIDDQVAVVAVAYPNFFGLVDGSIPEIVEMAHAAGALVVAVADPISLALLTPPGEWGADLCVGEGQPLGVPSSFGGPAVGFFAASKALIRRLPGRLVGETFDDRGRRGYVLTLQTREQHIRREKATSNICTNQGLMALSATVYLALLGKEGLREVADLCFQKTHHAASTITAKTGLKLAYDAPFLREFVLSLPIPAAELCRLGLERGLLVGVDLGRFEPAWEKQLLVAVTEKRTRSEIARWAGCIAEAVGQSSSQTAGVGASS